MQRRGTSGSCCGGWARRREVVIFETVCGSVVGWDFMIGVRGWANGRRFVLQIHTCTHAIFCGRLAGTVGFRVPCLRHNTEV
jgi:hypothetical protein